MIYFDNSATTALSEEAKAAMVEEMEHFANPSSVHAAGFSVHQRLEMHRQAVASTLSCSGDEVIFTSCGTESDNMAILGIAKALGKRGKTFLFTDSEHPAVMQCAKYLETKGFQVCYLSTKKGLLDLNEVESCSASGDVIGASLMHTNNETGAVYQVAEAFSLIRRQNPLALCHCDCVQAYGKTPLSFSLLQADLISVSAHKIHGPKGVGALAVKKGVRALPLLLGGGQERGLRSGTENTVGIAGFAAAAREQCKALAENEKKVKKLKAYLEQRLPTLPRVKLNTPAGKASPYLLSVQFPVMRSEVLLRMLSDHGICVSAGSACSAKVGKSPVLKAFGLTDKEADSTLRLSFSHENTPEQADALCNHLQQLLH